MIRLLFIIISIITYIIANDKISIEHKYDISRKIDIIDVNKIENDNYGLTNILYKKLKSSKYKNRNMFKKVYLHSKKDIPRLKSRIVKFSQIVFPYKRVDVERLNVDNSVTEISVQCQNHYITLNVLFDIYIDNKLLNRKNISLSKSFDKCNDNYYTSIDYKKVIDILKEEVIDRYIEELKKDLYG